MARRLTNLQISEISSCERGAAGDRDGRGKASVLLLKRDDSGERLTLADIAKALKALGRLILIQKRAAERRSETMSNVTNISVTDLIKGMKTVMPGPSIAAKVDAANEMLAKGRVDTVVHQEMLKRFADERYPGDPRALSKFINDSDGARMSNFAVQKSYEDTQRRTAANAAEVIAKMNKPHAVHAQPEPEDHDDDDGGEGTIDQKVERLMQSRNISRDAAISVLHRLEKRARGFTF